MHCVSKSPGLLHLSLRRLLFPLVLAAWFGFVSAAPAAPFDQNHPIWTRLLSRLVSTNGSVDYTRLKSNPQELVLYLDQLSKVGRTDFLRWTREEQIAFLCNAYNAFTLDLIRTHYPLKSIKDIGNVLRGPWDQPVVRIFGETKSLNTLEHKILRAEYAEPGIHFALVCAARGCPPLREEAYVGSRLQAQLNDQTRRFLASKSKNRIDFRNRIVHLSPIFDWYSGDFPKPREELLKFLHPYWPEMEGQQISPEFKIRFTDYDWSLNDAANPAVP